MVEKIKTGDKFRCKKDVLMDEEKVYIKGKVYVSEIDGCITDELGRKEHMWGRLKGLPNTCTLNSLDYTSEIFETYEPRKHKRKIRTRER